MYKPGDNLKIIGFNDQCPAPYLQKLLCIGFIPGHIFTITRVAPLGDPLEISIKGTQVSLRKSELSMIKVERV